MTKIAENGDISVELVVLSPGKRKPNSERQQDLENRESNEGKLDKETT